MSTEEFYNFAVLAAKDRGYDNPRITVHTICDSRGINHICKLWDSGKNKHIDSTLQSNPVSAIQAFKDAIEYENKTYSQISEGVNNCDECGDGSGWYGVYNCSKCNPQAI